MAKDVPHPHPDSLLGLFITAKELRINSSTKSMVDPLIKSIDTLSTTTFAPSLSKILQRGAK